MPEKLCWLWRSTGGGDADEAEEEAPSPGAARRKKARKRRQEGEGEEAEAGEGGGGGRGAEVGEGRRGRGRRDGGRRERGWRNRRRPLRAGEERSAAAALRMRQVSAGRRTVRRRTKAPLRQRKKTIAQYDGVRDDEEESG